MMLLRGGQELSGLLVCRHGSHVFRHVHKRVLLHRIVLGLHTRPGLGVLVQDGSMPQRHARPIIGVGLPPPAASTRRAHGAG
jgi:hypothetical protein